MRAGRVRPLRASDMKKDVRILLVGERESAPCLASQPGCPLQACQPLRFSLPCLSAPRRPCPLQSLTPDSLAAKAVAVAFASSSPFLLGLSVSRATSCRTLWLPVSHSLPGRCWNRQTEHLGLREPAGGDTRGRSAEVVTCEQGQVSGIFFFFSHLLPSLLLCMGIKRERWLLE